MQSTPVTLTSSTNLGMNSVWMNRELAWLGIMIVDVTNLLALRYLVFCLVYKYKPRTSLLMESTEPMIPWLQKLLAPKVSNLKGENVMISIGNSEIVC